jgi:putative hydrolase of the HAD superfamily
MSQRIRGILFDLGNTLIDFGRMDVEALFEAGARAAYAYLRELRKPLPSFHHFHRQQYWAVRWNYLKSLLSRREFNALDLMGRMARRMDQRLTDEEMDELAWRWYKPTTEVAHLEDGLPATLRTLRDAGLTLGVVSNTFLPPAVLDRHLAMEDLLEPLAVRVYSSETRVRKPNPRIFQIALRRAHLPAGRMFFVGDVLRTDIRGANRVGLLSVLKAPDGRLADPRIRPRHIIRRLAELPELVAKYNDTSRP